MKQLGPQLHRREDCERVLRSLPGWFGIEEALLMYAKDTEAMPTFALEEQGVLVSFLTLMKHFPNSWEVHCMAVHSRFRGKGHGTALLQCAESWLVEQGVQFLQVKTVAQASASTEYAETRQFYLAKGFTPLEVFPELWDPRNPALQLVKALNAS